MYGSPDAEPAGGADARPHADAHVVPPADAMLADATTIDGAPELIDATACAIWNGVAGPALDGDGDLAKYPGAQVLAPGATLAASDAIAVTWDRAKLYVTITSDAMLASYEPIHIYVETGGALAAAAPATGKEYGGLTPAVPFSATHAIAVRRVSDAGTGAYDGVFTGAGFTTRATPLAEGTDVFVSSDHRTVSIVVPWTALGGCPTAMRLAAHVVHGAAANEWKDLVPATTTPWKSPGGGYYEIDLTQPTAVSGWTLH